MASSKTEEYTACLGRVLSRLNNVRKSDDSWTACCPAHDDRHPSLSIGIGTEEQVLLHCHAGCSTESVLAAIGLEMKDLFPSSSATFSTRERSSHRKLTLLDFAVEKKLHWGFLINQGVIEESGGGLRITYYQIDGTPAARHRLRRALVAKEGSYWTKGPGDILPYGLERMEEARQAGYLILVEGETDTLTLRFHRHPVLGIPGAEMVRTTLKRDYLEGISHLYLFQEPDAAGHKFVEEIIALLESWSWTGKASVVSLPDAKDPNELHKRDPKLFGEAFQHAIDHAVVRYDHAPTITVSEREPSDLQVAIDAPFSLQHLLDSPFSATQWVIEDLLPEGLHLLAGKPKQGKSWLALQMALAVASGNPLFGSFPVLQGEVLYLALEDTPQRLQARSKHMITAMTTAPKGMTFAIQWPHLDQEGLLQFETYLQAHPQVRLIVIDTWARLAPVASPSVRTQYEGDYAALAPLKRLADVHRVSILVIHHLRKTSGQDVLDEITGSTGLVGAVDGILVLKRVREQGEATLFVTGRDLPEQSLSLVFDAEATQWKFASTGDESERNIS
jgi:hypothetical protein